MNKLALAQRDLLIVDAVAQEAGALIGRAASEMAREMDQRFKALEERIAALPLKEGPPGKDGETGKEGPPGPGWVPKGTWMAGQAYAALDVVVWKGSGWVAMVDNPGEIPGPGWQMFAQKGSGGPQGERGQQGPAGKDGIGIEALVKTDDGRTVLVLTDGRQVEAA
jgi:hypothetical protein